MRGSSCELAHVAALFSWAGCWFNWAVKSLETVPGFIF